MYFEIALLAGIILFIMAYNGNIDTNKFIDDNEMLFRRLKEDDWDFYVKAKYGDTVNPNVLFNKRIRNGVIVAGLLLFFFIAKLNYIKVIFAILAGVVVYKMDYSNMKSYYKKHLNEIDAMLPHYLKGLEILIQHYTVPVAMGKSMNDAPPIFREGLQQLVNEINAGNDTINPYMDFAKTYPVRDSMRMMRLLYRLSLGRQERKQEQILAFSRSISSLQQKARDTKYKNRLEKMEGKTMHMLVSTGVGVMILLVLAVLQMMNV
jgi:Flp pilus assembly protein TadB